MSVNPDSTCYVLFVRHSHKILKYAWLFSNQSQAFACMHGRYVFGFKEHRHNGLVPDSTAAEAGAE